ncbi:MAG TPA: DUF2752 domain-containing protein [Oscillospiraceae bacterium]|nr:DUF2752 domain-containing protein [Oscillospiraceae bacterium]HXK77249.1 DUF2752 domain-containing protein [Oscillospiraceae bacterium]
MKSFRLRRPDFGKIGARAAFAAIFCVLAGAGLFWIWNTADGTGIGFPCLVHELTGLYCSGCGASRALRALLHFQFYKALRYNAAFTLLFPFLAAYFLAVGYSFVRYGEDRVSCRVPVKPLWVILAAVLAFGVLRNLPAFSFLAPTFV